MTKYKTNSAQVSIAAKGIIKIQLFEGVELNENDAIENFIAESKLMDGDKHCLLVDQRSSSETKEALEFNLSKKVNETRVATAILINSPLKRFMNNLQVTLTQQDQSLRYFIEETEAIDWLKNQYDNRVTQTLNTVYFN